MKMTPDFLKVIVYRDQGLHRGRIMYCQKPIILPKLVLSFWNIRIASTPYHYLCSGRCVVPPQEALILISRSSDNLTDCSCQRNLFKATEEFISLHLDDF